LKEGTNEPKYKRKFFDLYNEEKKKVGTLDISVSLTKMSSNSSRKKYPIRNNFIKK